MHSIYTYISKKLFGKAVRPVLLIFTLSVFSVIFQSSCGPAKKVHIDTASIVGELHVVSQKELEKGEHVPQQVSADTVFTVSDTTYFQPEAREYFLTPFRVHTGRINVIEDVASSNRIFTGGQDGKIFEVTISDGAEGARTFSSKILAESSRPVLALAASPDGKYLAVSQFSLVSIINLKERKIEARFHRVKGRILAMAWDVNSQLLLLGRANGDIFSWNIGTDVSRASDSINVLEFYETNPSPVIKIVFHPSGRAFFAALQGGSVYLIRLVQTERELGLRLDTRKPGMKQGKYVVRIGGAPSMVNDMLLDYKTGQILVSAADGAIYRWRLRGLRKALPYPTGSDSTGFISLVHLSPSDDAEEEPEAYLTTLGRNLRIRLWCARDEAFEVIEPTMAVIKDGDDPESSRLELKSSEEDILDQLKSELFAEMAPPPEENDRDDTPPRGLIAETPRFLETVIAGRYSPASGILWVGDKTGTLAGFDVKSFLSSNHIKSQINKVCNRE
jgi:WD40 repeat protein